MLEHKLLVRRKIDFGALLKILAYGVRDYETYTPIGGAEVAFELYRWMTSSVTGENFERWSWETRWVRANLASDMSSRVGCGSSVRGWGDNTITPFHSSYDRHQDARPPKGWRIELASRFAHALLDEGKMAEWRAVMRIDTTKPRIVPLLAYDCVPPPPRSALRGFNGEPIEPLRWRPSYGDPTDGNGFAGEVDRLFALATPTRRLREQLNTNHPDAQYIQAVLLQPTHDGWIANIEYGFDGSTWDQDYRIKGWAEEDRARDQTHCKQKKDEPFSQFVYRAHDQFETLLTPACHGVPSCVVVGDGFTGRPRCNPQWAQDWTGARCEAGP